MRFVPALPEKLQWIKNKYFITALLVFVWLAFVDRFDFFTQYKLRKELMELEKEKTFYSAEIIRNKQTIDALNNNPQKREKFGREKYLMKKDDEDIFLIIDTAKVH